MQFDLIKNANESLKIFIYKDPENLLVANLAYTVEDSMKALLVYSKTFTFLGTIDASEIIGKIKLDNSPIPQQRDLMKKNDFLYGLMYTADILVKDPVDQKTLKGIINKITLV